MSKKVAVLPGDGIGPEIVSSAVAVINTLVSDIELIEIESRAWAKAKELCATYDVIWDEDYAENHLDSYRDWLHVTSLCHICNLAGYQDDAGLYHCPLCGASWPSRYRPE